MADGGANQRSQLEAIHARLAFAALKMKEQCRRRGEDDPAPGGEWALQITQRLMLNRVLVLPVSTGMHKNSVALFAIHVGFLHCSLGCLSCCAVLRHDDFRVHFVSQVVVETLLRTKLPIADKTRNKRDVQLSQSVCAVVCSCVEPETVIMAPAVAGFALVLMKPSLRGELLSTCWTDSMYVPDVVLPIGNSLEIPLAQLAAHSPMHIPMVCLQSRVGLEEFLTQFAAQCPMHVVGVRL